MTVADGNDLPVVSRMSNGSDVREMEKQLGF